MAEFAFDQQETLSSQMKPLDQWAVDHRHVEGGPKPGPWNFDNAPMALEPMRAVSDREVREVTLCTPAQLMKSEFCINVALWSAYYARDVLLYEPDRNLLKEMMGKRVRQAMLAFGGYELDDPGKRGPKRRDSVTGLQYPGGGMILGLTPKMTTGKSGWSAPVVVIDEQDKMGDTQMTTVARSRSRTYAGDAIIVKASTCTQDLPGTVWRSWNEGSRGTWKGCCPRCGSWVSVMWNRVKFDTDSEGYWLADGAALVCEVCDAHWSETERQWAVRNGRYVHAVPGNTVHRSFHVPGCAHIFGTLDDIVREGAALWRAAIEEEEWENYQLFVNERLGEVWDPDIEGLSARKMERITFDMGASGKDWRGNLDRRAVLVTAGVDIGEHEIHTEFCAWGVDLATGNVLCWGLEFIVLGGSPDDTIEKPDLWEQFSALIDNSVWKHDFAGGILVPAERVLIDCGYRPEIIRAYCVGRYGQQLRISGDQVRAFGARILPLMSRSRERGKHPIDLQTGENLMRSGKIQGNIPATVLINSNQIKDFHYSGLLRDRRLPDDVQKSNLWPVDAENRGYTAGYFRQMANERRVISRTKTGRIVTHWEVKAGQAKKNDAFDARIYGVAAAMVCVYPDSLQVGLLKRALRDARSSQSHWTNEERDRMIDLLETINSKDPYDA